MKEAMTMKETIDAIDLAYKIYESNNFQMPTRMQVIEGEKHFSFNALHDL